MNLQTIHDQHQVGGLCSRDKRFYDDPSATFATPVSSGGFATNVSVPLCHHSCRDLQLVNYHYHQKLVGITLAAPSFLPPLAS